MTTSAFPNKGENGPRERTDAVRRMHKLARKQAIREGLIIVKPKVKKPEAKRPAARA